MFPVFMGTEEKVFGKKGTQMTTKGLSRLRNEHGFRGRKRRRIKIINDEKKKHHYCVDQQAWQFTHAT
jgi:hypothetical protein